MSNKNKPFILRFLAICTSMPAMAILSLLIILALAAATFIEYIHSTAVAQQLIYHHILFELACFYYALVLIINIINKKLFNKKKAASLLFHLAILFILAGAAITRYFGEEGSLRIRENKTASAFLTRDNYVQVQINDGSNIHNIEQKVNITPFSKKDYHQSISIGENKMQLRSIDYIPNAQAQFINTADGVPVVFLSIKGEQQNMEIPMMQGDYLKTPMLSISCDIGKPADLNIRFADQSITIFASHDLEMLNPQTDSIVYFPPRDSIPLYYMHIYRIKGVEFTMANYLPSIELRYHSSDDPNYADINMVQFQINYQDQTESFYLPQIHNKKGENIHFNIADASIDITYGAKEIPLPFSLTLNDFMLETYPGSQSPSDFVSKLSLTDEEKNYTAEETVSMNNVLQYRGYRFYQTSYDRDHKGTLLSVNHDPWGIRITYLGYILLFAAIAFSLISPYSFFRKRIKALQTKTFVLFFLAFFATTSLFAQNQGSPDEPVDKQVATDFGKVLVQDQQGRIKPMNTFSRELLRKLSGNTSYAEHNADQFHLGMIMQAEQWQLEPIFYVENLELRKILEMQGEYISFYDFFLMGDPDLYKLNILLAEAYEKAPKDRTSLDKEAISLDERLNIFLMIQSGIYLRVFPHPTYDSLPWLSPLDQLEDMRPIDSLFVKKSFPTAIQMIYAGETAQADSIFVGMQKFQQQFGGDHIPSPRQINAEVFYNNYRPYGVLAVIYAVLGILMLLLILYHHFKEDIFVSFLIKIGKYLIALGALVQLAAFALRWYIAIHVPLSNGYESILFVSLAIILVSIFFIKKYPIVLAIAALMSALSLLVAHLSWMDPAITNLVPVLQSPWLTIHVAIIMIAYAMLGITALIALVNILVSIFILDQNKKRIHTLFNELVLINKILLTPAVYFLAAGCFLGAIWANEAWGRYWSWDPKETWTLISIMIYSILAHVQNIRFFNNNYRYNYLVLFAFSTILMTYFGVNYFLGGMHSYAGGDMQELPAWWYFVLSTIVLLTAYGGYKHYIFYKKDNAEKPTVD